MKTSSRHPMYYYPFPNNYHINNFIPIHYPSSYFPYQIRPFPTVNPALFNG
ncbi:hypothetical protein [Bacillus sp. 03113]|uniref:hypothetical protein n=1 Tax=Bacillus sp. 03113 TaxID=2578211 RepID=UPI0015E883BE|nr:hypothetical protein [Bacillus sp. 03113]